MGVGRRSFLAALAAPFIAKRLPAKPFIGIDLAGKADETVLVSAETLQANAAAQAVFAYARITSESIRLMPWQKHLLNLMASDDLHYKYGRMDAHHWGYYFRHLTGQPAPAPEQVGLGNGTTLITCDEWTDAISSNISPPEASSPHWSQRES